MTKIKRIKFLMLVKNVESKSVDVFKNVISQASKLSKHFLIVDNGSTDNTKEIIKSFKGLDIEYMYDNNKDYDYLKYKYSKKLDSKYIFVLDDDEVLSNELIKELNNKLNGNIELFWIKWDTMFLNYNIDKKLYKPTLFRSDRNILSGNLGVHNLEDKSKIKSIHSNYKTKYSMKHYSFPDIEFMKDKSIEYAKKRSEMLFNKYGIISNKKLLTIFIKDSLSYLFYNLFVLRYITSIKGIFYSLNALIVRYYMCLYYMERIEKIKNLERH